MARKSASTQSFGELSPWAEPAWSHGIASPYYNNSHFKLRDALRKYVDTYILPDSLDWEAKGEAPREEQLRWAKSGFAFADVPAKYRPKDNPGPADIPVDELDVFHLLVSTDETSRVEGGVTSCLGGMVNARNWGAIGHVPTYTGTRAIEWLYNKHHQTSCTGAPSQILLEEEAR